jgi:hypothetical protein
MLEVSRYERIKYYSDPVRESEGINHEETDGSYGVAQAEADKFEEYDHADLDSGKHKKE